MGVHRPRINGLSVMRPPRDHPNPKLWNELRIAALERDGHACRCCPNDAASGVPLEIHHRHYETWGRETLADVVTLCVLCHDAITSRIRETTEYTIAPAERMPRADRPATTVATVAVDGEPERRERVERPAVSTPRVTVEPSRHTGLPPRDRPRR